MTEPARLPLARGTLDRAAERRQDDRWLARAWDDEDSRVIVIERGQALVRWPDGSDGSAASDGFVAATPATGPGTGAAGSGQHHVTAGTPALALLRPDETPAGERYLLGVDPGGVAYFAVSAPLPPTAGTARVGLRQVGARLGDRDAGLMTHAVALANWHATHTHCPRCGHPTVLAAAGHSRKCPEDESEHFPRIDPAVIMLVRDSRDRILLARGPDWPAGGASILAGFVEPGESLEQAVAREVREEVGLAVRDIRYWGNQPWPLPQSLMLGFFARAEDGQELAPDLHEIAEARWWTRTEVYEATGSGALRLSGAVSIARWLIESWYGDELPGERHR